MIQRIQSVYLGVAAVLLVLPILFNVSLVTMSNEAGTYSLLVDSIVRRSGDVTELASNCYPIAGALVLSLFVSVYSIAQYGSRKFQMKLVQLAMVLQLVLIGLLVFCINSMMGLIGEDHSTSYNPWLGVPIVCFVLFFLAWRGIKKDEELVRSADRLR